MIKLYKKVTLVLLVGILITSVTSCEDVLVNENPNGVILSELSPEVIMPGAQARPSATLMTFMNEVGNTMIATWSGNAQQIQAPFFVEFTHQIDPDFYDIIWDQLFLRTSNLSNIVNYSGSGNYDYFIASSKILRAFYFQYLVDLYGDIPYTDRHLRGELLFPSYDSQADIYRSLVAEINEAIDLINTTDSGTAVDMGSNDIMMAGDMLMWQKFGNSLKLRILVRLSELANQDSETATFIQTEYSALNSSGAQFLGLGEDVTINPGYEDVTSKMNPFAEVYGYAPGGFGNQANATVDNVIVGPTNYLVEMLNGTTNGISDPRLTRLYTTRGGQSTIQGNTQGGAGQPSRLGPGLLNSPSQDGFIMTAAESLLLQAEAAHRGYLTSGSAKALFQDAIQASFDMLGAGDASDYIDDSDNVVGIGWEGSTDKIEAIITQKWIALGGTNGAETWIEFSRTGYPSNMPLPEITSQTTQPKRLLYPSSEYVGNTANVSVYNQQAPTSAFNTSIFWDVN